MRMYEMKLKFNSGEQFNPKTYLPTGTALVSAQLIELRFLHRAPEIIAERLFETEVVIGACTIDPPASTSQHPISAFTGRLGAAADAWRFPARIAINPEQAQIVSVTLDMCDEHISITSSEPALESFPGRYGDKLAVTVNLIYRPRWWRRIPFLGISK